MINFIDNRVKDLMQGNNKEPLFSARTYFRSGRVDVHVVLIRRINVVMLVSWKCYNCSMSYMDSFCCYFLVVLQKINTISNFGISWCQCAIAWCSYCFHPYHSLDTTPVSFSGPLESESNFAVCFPLNNLSFQYHIGL